MEAAMFNAGLLTRQELIDAVAVGQMTPGPVLSTATFIGYQLGGFTGAMAATVGIFLPSFLFVLLLNPMVHKIRKYPLLSAFLCIEMGMETLVGWRTIVIAIASLIIVFYFKKVNSAFVVLGGAVLGWVLMQLG